jgi:hypothetical protein
MEEPMQPADTLFRTVSDVDHLGFWSKTGFRAKSVAEFLELQNADVAKITHVARNSVRFDDEIPRDMRERLEEIAVICNLVAQFFLGDAQKTALWFRTKNPMLGDISPRDMIRFGRYDKLRRFIIEAQSDRNTDRRVKGQAGKTSGARDRTKAATRVETPSQ